MVAVEVLVPASADGSPPSGLEGRAELWPWCFAFLAGQDSAWIGIRSNDTS
jgi:hypothetical protein